jgi:hypothetical protein
MSAPEITTFLPAGRSYDQMMHSIVSMLSLDVDTLPPGYPFAFAAQRLHPKYFLIEYGADAIDHVDEMSQWEKLTHEYKLFLQECESYINIHYRSLDLAKQCLAIISNYLGESSSRSVVENGYGCLLRFRML